MPETPNQQPVTDPTEARVDAMMDPRVTAPPVPKRPAPPATPFDIFANQPKVTPSKSVLPVARPLLVSDVTQPKPAAVVKPTNTTDDISVQPLLIDTPATDAAIADIVAQEADEVLAAQDAGITAVRDLSQPAELERPHGHPFFWFFIILLVILIAVAALFVTSPGLTPSFLPNF